MRRISSARRGSRTDHRARDHRRRSHRVSHRTMTVEGANTAVHQMDHLTQQNAAMVEEATAATRGLEGETGS